MKNIAKENSFEGYSSGSGCPLPRSAKVTTANAIATPAAAPNAAIPASAI